MANLVGMLSSISAEYKAAKLQAAAPAPAAGLHPAPPSPPPQGGAATITGTEAGRLPAIVGAPSPAATSVVRDSNGSQEEGNNGKRTPPPCKGGKAVAKRRMRNCSDLDVRNCQRQQQQRSQQELVKQMLLAKRGLQPAVVIQRRRYRAARKRQQRASRVVGSACVCVCVCVCVCAAFLWRGVSECASLLATPVVSFSSVCSCTRFRAHLRAECSSKRRAWTCLLLFPLFI